MSIFAHIIINLCINILIVFPATSIALVGVYFSNIAIKNAQKCPEILTKLIFFSDVIVHTKQPPSNYFAYYEKGVIET